MLPLRTAAANRNLLVGLIAVVLLAAAAWLLFWNKGPAEPTVDEGRKIAEEFLSLLERGEAAKAWDSTTAEFKSALGRERFVSQAAQAPILKKPLQFASTQAVNVSDAPRIEFVYQPSDGAGMVRLLVAQEAGAWKIDRATF